MNTAGAQFYEYQHIQSSQKNRLTGKEITGKQLVFVMFPQIHFSQTHNQAFGFLIWGRPTFLFVGCVHLRLTNSQGIAKANNRRIFSSNSL
jgi:hypothetical protein